MTKSLVWLKLAVAMALLATIAAVGSQTTLAQGPRPGRPSIDAQAFNACTTTDFTGIAAKLLNITPAVLRKDIVDGQTLPEVAKAANVDYQSIADALFTARKAEADQAVKDGVMTQDEAAPFETAPNTAATQAAPPPAATRPARPQGGQNGPAAIFPDISTIRLLLAQASGTQPAAGGGFGGGGFGGVAAGLFNMVKQYEVAAQAVNMKCTDLVKTLITPPGKSVVMVAADAKIDTQAVTDAFTKAYKDALAQDVTDNVITQAQSDQLTAGLDKTIQVFINNPLPMGLQVTPTPAQ